MSLLAVVALVLVGMYGGVSFSPGRPTDGQTQTADITGGLQRAEPLVGFDVVIPGDLPADWTPSSFSFTEQPGTAAAPPAVRGGWLTEEGRFITLIQSSGAVADVQQRGAGIGQCRDRHRAGRRRDLGGDGRSASRGGLDPNRRRCGLPDHRERVPR